MYPKTLDICHKVIAINLLFNGFTSSTQWLIVNNRMIYLKLLYNLLNYLLYTEKIRLLHP